MLLKIIDLAAARLLKRRRECSVLESVVRFRTPSSWSIVDLPTLDPLLSKCPQMDGQFYGWTALV
jgi:hypothetical protein